MVRMAEARRRHAFHFNHLPLTKLLCPSQDPDEGPTFRSVSKPHLLTICLHFACKIWQTMCHQNWTFTLASALVGKRRQRCHTEVIAVTLTQLLTIFQGSSLDQDTVCSTNVALYKNQRFATCVYSRLAENHQLTVRFLIQTVCFQVADVIFFDLSFQLL